MDDFAQLILIGIVIVISIVKGLNKAAEQVAEEPEEMMGEFSSEEMDTPPVVVQPSDDELEEQRMRKKREAMERRRRILMGEEQRKAQTATVAQRKKENGTVEAHSLEEIIDELAAYKQRTAPQSKQAAVRPSQSTSAQLQAQQMPQVDQEEGSRIAAEFDLERAVIYSEILQPKYKEYE